MSPPPLVRRSARRLSGERLARLEGPHVDHACAGHPALIGRPQEGRVAGAKGRTAREQSHGLCRTAVVLQRAEVRVDGCGAGAYLVALRAVDQETARRSRKLF